MHLCKVSKTGSADMLVKLKTGLEVGAPDVLKNVDLSALTLTLKKDMTSAELIVDTAICATTNAKTLYTLELFDANSVKKFFLINCATDAASSLKSVLRN